MPAVGRPRGSRYPRLEDLAGDAARALPGESVARTGRFARTRGTRRAVLRASMGRPERWLWVTGEEYEPLYNANRFKGEAA